MEIAITRLTAVAAVAATALLLVAALLLAGNSASGSGPAGSATIKPAAPAVRTTASASRFSPNGRRWI